MQYALIRNSVVENVIEAYADFVELIAPQWDAVEPLTPGAGIGWRWEGGEFVAPEAAEQIPVPVDPAKWLIDVGPFFDRFGSAKMGLLMSTNGTVKALISDLQVRKWVDLKRTDVAQGIDAMIALAVPGVTAALKTAILTTPVSAEENLALRRQYFA